MTASGGRTGGRMCCGAEGRRIVGSGAMRRSTAESLSRTAALIALGAFAVHQLRYLAGYGHEAGSELSRQGHGYLAGALPVLAAFLLSAVAAGLLRAALGRRAGAGAPAGLTHRRDTSRAAPLSSGWASLSSSVARKRSRAPSPRATRAGWRRCLAQGGWLALPLAGLLGALCALLDRGIATLEAAIAGYRALRAPARSRQRSRPTALGRPGSAQRCAAPLRDRPPASARPPADLTVDREIRGQAPRSNSAWRLPRLEPRSNRACNRTPQGRASESFSSQPP